MSISLWHGSARWEGPKDFVAGNAGQRTNGIGLYCTTSYLRARRYAAGGGNVVRLEISDDIGWLEKTSAPVDIVMAWMREIPRLPRRKELLALIPQYVRSQSNEVSLELVQNLLLEGRDITPTVGQQLTRFLVDNGVDASLNKVGSQEHWVLIYNPKVIEKHRVVPAREVQLAEYDLPLIEPKPRAPTRTVEVYHGGAEWRGWRGTSLWGATRIELAQNYCELRRSNGIEARVSAFRFKFRSVFDADAMPKAATISDFVYELFRQSPKCREIPDSVAELTATIRAASRREESGPYYSRQDFWYQASSYFGEDGVEAIQQLRLLAGFDAIHFTESESPTYGVFSASQVEILEAPCLELDEMSPA